VRRSQVTHHPAPLSFDLMQVPVKQEQQVVDVHVIAMLIHHGDAVGITVGRQAQVVVLVAHVRAQHPQRIQVRRGRAPTEERVVALMNEGNPTARLIQDDSQRQVAHAVHRVDDHLQPRPADSIHVDQGLDAVDVSVGKVTPLYYFCFQRDIDGNLDHVRGGYRVGFLLDAVGFVGHQQRPVAVEYLQTVPGRRVVAGGKRQAVGGMHCLGGKLNQRSRAILGKQHGMDVVAGKHFGSRLCSTVGEEAPIVADQHAALLQPTARDIIRQCLAQAAHVMQRKSLADHCPPAARTELDDVLLFLAPRAEITLLEDEFRLLQVGAGVDPLDFVRVIDLVALYLQAAVDQLIGRVGQAVFPVPLRGAQRFQHWPDILR